MKKQSAGLLSLKLVLAIMLVISYGCEKSEMAIPPEAAHIVRQGIGKYTMNTPNDVYLIPVAYTTRSNVDRTITLSISSPTGAQEGTHYTVEKSVVIPAGKTIDTLVFAGVFDEYLTGREDTVVFTLEEHSESIATFGKSFTLVVTGPCFDGDVKDINVMGGTYTKAYESGGSYGPYPVLISNITSTGPTSAKGRITNLYGAFGPVDIEFDWSDPNNTVVNIPLQPGLVYQGDTYLVQTSPGRTSKFSVCDQRLFLYIDVLIENGVGPGQHEEYDMEVDVVIGR